MRINGEYVPEYILEDFCKPRTRIELASGWKISFNLYETWLYNEAKEPVVFGKATLESRIIALLAKESKTVNDLQGLLNEPLIKAFIGLWLRGVILLAVSSEATGAEERAVQPRYKWFHEYLKKYGGHTLGSHDMIQKLRDAKVCVIGIGGTGSLVSLSLAASGVGTIRLVDGDVVEESNLSRQILFSEASIGNSKVSVLKTLIEENNSDAKIEAFESFVDSYETALSAIDKSDFVILCADQPRFKIRGWVGQACYKKNIPHLSMAGNWIGPLSLPNKSPCYACIGRFHGARLSDAVGFIKSVSTQEIPPRASFGPRLLIGAGYMATVVMHFLTGIDRETPLHRRFGFDLFGNLTEEKVVRYKDCQVCGSGSTQTV